MVRNRKKSVEKLRGKHILVVEDHPAMGEYLTMLLQHYDHASYARSGNEALKQIEQQPPDIILLDLTLPDMTGLEVARSVRQNKKTKAIPILAMSGYPIDTKCLAAGCNDFIRKPFAVPSLLERLVRLLGSHR